MWEFSGALLAVLLLGCTPRWQSSDHAIVGGDLTTGFESVVSVYWLGGFVCSGVAVEPRTVLTAAHCLYGYPADDPALSVRFGPQAESPDREILATSFAIHPEYSTNVAHDLARITLSEDAPVAPTGWNTDGLDDSLLGTTVDVVGFGLTVADETDPDFFKRRAGVTIDEVTDLQIKWFGDEGNLCDGDSGGAAFDGDVLLGLLVEGDANCAEWGAALRLDAHAGWLDGSEPGDDDDSFALPDDDDDVAPAQCSGCSTGGGYPGLWVLLLLVRRKRPSN